MESERELGGRRPPTVVSGPLAGYSAGFRQELIDRGYSRRAIGDQMSMVADLGQWLLKQGLEMTALQSAAEIDRFFAERRARGCRARISSPALAALLGFLRDREVIGPVAEPLDGPADRLLAEYRAYLSGERGAASSTIRGFTACAAMFLDAIAAPGRPLGEVLNGLSAAEVITFVAGWARSRSHAYGKSMVSALRSLLRFLHVAGYIARPLDAAVPAVPGWEPVRAPHRVSGREITASWRPVTGKAPAGGVTTPSSCSWPGWDCARPRSPGSGSVTSTGGRACSRSGARAAGWTSFPFPPTSGRQWRTTSGTGVPAAAAGCCS